MPTLIDQTRKRAPDARPQQILEAALEIFGEQGLAGARLDDIARRAGIAKGTIYLYFDGKEALFREVVRRTVVDRLERAATELADLPDADPVGALRTYLHAWWEFASTPAFQTVYRLVVGELHRYPDLAHFYATEVVQRSVAIVGRLLEHGIARGAIRPVDPVATTRMMASLVISQALWSASPIAAGLRPPHEDAFRHGPTLGGDSMREQVAEFVLHALRPEHAPAGAPPAPTPALRARRT